MSDAVHRLTIAMMERSLRNIGDVMDKARAHAEAEEIGLDVLLQSRLFPDMFNLLQQLQYVCYIPVDFARHFTSAQSPHVGYDESTWEQLRESIDTTANYLASIRPADVAAKAEIVVPIFFDDSRGLAAQDYAATVIVPDFYFHMTVAYAILRHNGVKLGKRDFLGNISAATSMTG
jgi:hypothetical protein